MSEFSTQLKKCNFNCSYGKPVTEMLLRLQFIRGLRDNDIQVKLIQEYHELPFKNIFEMVTAIEISKTETN